MTPEHFLRIIRKWTIPIILLVTIGAGVAFAVSRVIRPLYRAQGQLLVIASPQPLVPLDVTQITSTYAALLIEPLVLQKVSADLAGRRSVSQLQDEVTATPTTNTLLIDVAATDPEPQMAAQIVNQAMKDFASQLADENEAHARASAAGLSAQIATVTQQLNALQNSLVQAQRAKQDTTLIQQEISSTEQQLFQLGVAQLSLQTQQSGSQLSVRVAAGAASPTVPASPNTRTNALLGAFGGLLVGVALAVLLQYLDQSVRDEEEVRQKLGLPTLAIIPRLAATPRAGNSATRHRGRADEQAAEAFRLLRAIVGSAATQQDRQSVVITSARTGDGTSHTSANLGRVVAAAGHSVCLLDANLRQPSLHRIFNRPSHEGLTEMLARSAQGVPSDLNGEQSTVHPNLHLITSGTLPWNPSELLASQRAVALLRWLEHQFDLVIIDTPAIEAVSDALSLSAAAAATVLVIDPGRTQSREALKALEALRGVGANVIGVVLNRGRVHSRGSLGAFGPHPSTAEDPTATTSTSTAADRTQIQAHRGRQ